MNLEQEIRFDEPDAETDDLARRIIGCAIEVHRRLGPGLDEDLYENALCIELELHGISFLRQPTVVVDYKGREIGKKRLDLIVEGKIVVELKAIEQLTSLHKAQVRTYLRITQLRIGLLINFNVAILKDGIRRIISS